MQIKTPTKAMAAAILVTLGLMLAAGAAEQSQPSAPADLDKLVGQPVDLSPWTYVWRADREVQEKPESWFIPRRLKRIDEVYRPLVEMQFPGVMPHVRGNTMPGAPKGKLLAAQLWLAPVPTQRIELRWPEGSVVPPAEAIEVRAYPSDVGWFGFVVDKVLAAPAVSADGRTLTYLNETQDSQGKKTPLFGSTDMVAVFLDQSKTPAGAKYGCPSIHLRLANDRMVWSEINLEIEWGFQPGTEQAVFDGRIESWCAYVKSVKPLPEDKGTEMTGANTWRSSPTGSGRRGIAVSVIYLGRWDMNKYVAPIHGRITLLTKGGDVTVMPGDAIDGPILIPGVGVMVSKAGGKATARQVADELAAKNPKTIPQLAREHPEAASWEELMRKVKEPGTVIPPLVPFEEPPVTAMRVSLPDERWTDAWRRSSWLLKEAKYKPPQQNLWVKSGSGNRPST